MVSLNFTMVLQVINFLIAFGIIVYLAYKPLTKAIAARQQQIQDSLDAAEQSNKEAKELKEEYNAQIRDAHRKAQEIIDRAAKTADEAKAEIIEKSKLEADRILKQAMEDITREKDEMMVDVKTYIADLSVSVASKIIAAELSADKQAVLIEEYIKEVGDMPC